MAPRRSERFPSLPTRPADQSDQHPRPSASPLPCGSAFSHPPCPAPAGRWPPTRTQQVCPGRERQGERLNLRAPHRLETGKKCQANPDRPVLVREPMDSVDRTSWRPQDVYPIGGAETGNPRGLGGGFAGLRPLTWRRWKGSSKRCVCLSTTVESAEVIQRLAEGSNFHPWFTSILRLNSGGRVIRGVFGRKR